MKFTLLAIVLVCVAAKANAIKWNGNWAHKCNFHGKDLTSRKSPGHKCYDICKSTHGCTHFVWTNNDGGMCWMKKGKVCKSEAVPKHDSDTVCGVVHESCGGSSHGGSSSNGAKLGKKGELLWSEEFDYWGRPREDVWNQQTEDMQRDEWHTSGWGNNELQWYTKDENSHVKDGKLIIEARKQNRGHLRYTSGRIRSTKMFQYGIIETRVKVAVGRGIWSGIFMMGREDTGHSWPSCGEIDILEYLGYRPGMAFTTIHTGKFNHRLDTEIQANTHLNNVEQFHTYTLDWTPSYLKVYLDGVLFYTYNKADRDGSFGAWPFDAPFMMQINLAVGGEWGAVEGVDDGIFPQTLEIDYIRHYQNGFVHQQF